MADGKKATEDLLRKTSKVEKGLEKPALCLNEQSAKLIGSLMIALEENKAELAQVHSWSLKMVCLLLVSRSGKTAMIVCALPKAGSLACRQMVSRSRQKIKQHVLQLQN